MKELFDQTSLKTSILITKAYSTSFSAGIYMLGANVRPKIYAIYGFVRLLDEVVDSFEGYPQEKLLTQLIDQYHQSLELKISTNTILNAFQSVVHEFELQELVESFIDSMKMDLYKKDYSSDAEYKKYITGSAESVGLMCLKVFVDNDPQQYEALKPYAIKLGSAFQKINFLRDINDDMDRLGRSYFPNVDWTDFNQSQKEVILNEIKEEFKEALIGITKLPDNCRFGVYTCYKYYLNLLKKIESKNPAQILNNRIRIPNYLKFIILNKALIRYKLNVL